MSVARRFHTTPNIMRVRYSQWLNYSQPLMTHSKSEVHKQLLFWEWYCYVWLTRLSQPWHKVATMLFYNLVTTLAQPWHNLVFWNCRKVVTRLSEHCHKVVRTQGCHNATLWQPWHNLVFWNCRKVVTRWWQGCHKVVRTLSQGCHNVPCHNLVFWNCGNCNKIVKCIIKFQNVYF